MPNTHANATRLLPRFEAQLKTLIYTGIGYSVNALGIIGLALLLSHGAITDVAIVRLAYSLFVCLIFWATTHVQLVRASNSRVHRPAIDALAPILTLAIYLYVGISYFALAVAGFIPHLERRWEMAFHLVVLLTFARPMFAILGVLFVSKDDEMPCDGPVPARKLSNMVEYEASRITSGGSARKSDGVERSIASLLKKLSHDLRYSVPADERIAQNFDYVVFADDLEDVLSVVRNISWPLADQTLACIVHDRLVEADKQLTRFLIANGRAL